MKAADGAAADWDALKARQWPPSTPFRTRLRALQEVLQGVFDRAPKPEASVARVAVTMRLSLGDLAVLLPPAEQRLLAHLRARRPLKALLGTPGFHSRRRLDDHLRLVVSRVDAYCGAEVRRRLLQPYDRPGHDHHRRPGRPRRIVAAERFPILRIWAPPWFVERSPARFNHHRDCLRAQPRPPGRRVMPSAAWTSPGQER